MAKKSRERNSSITIAAPVKNLLDKTRVDLDGKMPCALSMQTLITAIVKAFLQSKAAEKIEPEKINKDRILPDLTSQLKSLFLKGTRGHENGKKETESSGSKR